MILPYIFIAVCVLSSFAIGIAACRHWFPCDTIAPVTMDYHPIPLNIVAYGAMDQLEPTIYTPAVKLRQRLNYMEYMEKSNTKELPKV